jgi:hypothetical protein
MYKISSIDHAGGTEYRVWYEAPATFAHLKVFAKDELDAYTKALAEFETREKRMRTIYICITMVILALVAALTFAGQAGRAEYRTNMAHCVKAGKSYVSEGNGYSCRSAAAAPKIIKMEKK